MLVHLRHEVLEEGVMRQGAEGRSMFQLYRGSREAKGSQMLSVARECLGIFGLFFFLTWRRKNYGNYWEETRKQKRSGQWSHWKGLCHRRYQKGS